MDQVRHYTQPPVTNVPPPPNWAQSSGQNNIQQNPLAQLFPVFSQSDFERTRNTARAIPLPSDTNLWDIVDPAERERYLGPMGWRITPDAMQRYFGAGNRENVFGSVSGAEFGPEASWTDTNYWPEFDEQGNLTGMTIKTGQNAGTFVPYVAGPDGTFTPDFSQASQRGYKTNDRAGNIALGLGALGLFGPALMAGMGGAAPATGGAAASGGGTTAPWLPSNAAAGVGGGMSVPGAGGGMSIPGSGIYGGAAAGAAAASSLPSWLQTATTLGRGFSTLANLLGPRGIGGAIHDRNAMDRTGRGLQDLFNRMYEGASPYLERLRESYENPQAFLSSPEFTSGRDIYKNSIDRQAARAGTLANPTQREILLDKYGMQAMQDYRRGLIQSAEPYLGMARASLPGWQQGMAMENWKNSPWGEAFQRIGQIDWTKTGKDLADAWKIISGWFS